jgi:hypothetical protein
MAVMDDDDDVGLDIILPSRVFVDRRTKGVVVLFFIVGAARNAFTKRGAPRPEGEPTVAATATTTNTMTREQYDKSEHLLLLLLLDSDRFREEIDDGACVL